MQIPVIFAMSITSTLLVQVLILLPFLLHQINICIVFIDAFQYPFLSFVHPKSIDSGNCNNIVWSQNKQQHVSSRTTEIQTRPHSRNTIAIYSTSKGFSNKATETKKTTTSTTSLSSKATEQLRLRRRQNLNGENNILDDIQSKLLQWSDQNNIRIATSFIRIQCGTTVSGSSANKYNNHDDDGLGWYCCPNKEIPKGSVLISVPSDMALSVVTSTTNNADTTTTSTAKQSFSSDNSNNFPWFVQMSLKLNELRNQNSMDNKDNNNRNSNNDDTNTKTTTTIDYKPWIDSLPKSFDTPFHWSCCNNSTSLNDILQYKFLSESIQNQHVTWNQLYNQVLESTNNQMVLSYYDFVWGCEIARSRTFSSKASIASSPYNPTIFPFVLLLSTIYVGTNLGTIEQAANGIGLVLSITILKDFVLPKLFNKNKRRYVICPMIDIANHKSMTYQSEVTFDYFSNSYSLATTSSIQSGEQVYISYGPRSNDQLLQYYGFIEKDNPHDVYIMDPIKEWDLSIIETSCGRSIAPGRLLILEQAGLLDGSSISSLSQVEAETTTRSTGDDKNSSSIYRRGGVVVTKSVGMDPAAMQVLRVLVSTDTEWDVAIQSGMGIGFFQNVDSGGIENEQCVRSVVKAILTKELQCKPTTINEDEQLLQQLIIQEQEEEEEQQYSTTTTISTIREMILAIQFRIEKKKLLQQCINELE